MSLERLNDLRNNFEAVHNQMLSDAIELGQYGWTYPLWSTARDINEILKDGASDAVDAFFLNEYTRDNGATFDAMVKELNQVAQIEPWRDLLDECTAVYHHELYRVAIPSLLIILEGVCAHGAGKFKTADVKTGDHIKELHKDMPFGSIRYLFKLSADSFADALFSYRHFSDVAPEQLNRHWVAHGRSPATWKAPDCLRLFQALQGMTLALD